MTLILTKNQIEYFWNELALGEAAMLVEFKHVIVMLRVDGSRTCQ